VNRWNHFIGTRHGSLLDHPRARTSLKTSGFTNGRRASRYMGRLVVKGCTQRESSIGYNEMFSPIARHYYI